MKKRLVTAILFLVLCLSLLPSGVLADSFELDMSTPPMISDLEILLEDGAARVQVKVRTPEEVRSNMNLLSMIEKSHYISGVQLSLSLEGKGWQEMNMTVAGGGDKWSGRWKTEAVSGLSEESWVQVRARYSGTDDNGNPIYSNWSETLSINEDSGSEELPFEFNAHDWAKPELTEADGAGLIPADLRSADLKEPITRAEFTAVSVKVYEALSGLTAEPAAENPFTDTADVEVLKALNVGVTNGVSDTEFAPASLLNREQAATMLSRVYKKVAFAGWTLTTDGDYADAFRALFTMPEPFADDADISSWARDSVYFMAANGVLNGVGNNCFAPKLVTSGEETLNHATREQAILIAVRLVKNLSGS